MNMNQYSPVTYGEGSAANPEDGKVVAMRKFISYVRQQAQMLQQDVEMIDDVSNRFIPTIGFSDDDERNLQAMSDKLSDEEEKSLKMYTTKTGEKKKFNDANTGD
jgi:RNAse (barnase) inhibitor barstar